VAKEWEEQAKADLEAHSRQLLEDFEKQLEALSAAARERQRSDAEAFKGVLQSRLNQAARLLEGLTTDVGQAKGVAHEQSTEPPSRSPRPPLESPQLALEPLLEKQRQIIEEALGSFRAKLKQSLGGHTSKG
jgi:exonuclease VII large subunit